MSDISAIHARVQSLRARHAERDRRMAEVQAVRRGNFQAIAPDLFSAQGLRNLGPTLVDWRRGWGDRLARNPAEELDLPRGSMEPLGYVVMQAGMRLSRPVKAYQRWISRMPQEYNRSVVRQGEPAADVESDPWCLGLMRHYQSLMPLAQDAQKPMFHLRPADGAIGAHQDAVRRCGDDFLALTTKILDRIDGRDPTGRP